MKTRILRYLALSIVALPVSAVLYSFSPCIAADLSDPVIARVNDVAITGSQLEKVVAAYKKKARKMDISQEEKKALIQSLIQRQLLLQQDGVANLRNNEEVVQKTNEYENNLVIRLYLQNHIAGSIQVSDEEIRAYYQENAEKFLIPARAVARHILLKNREDAERVLAKLEAGEDFGEMAKQYSIDLPMALEGGQMGIIEKGKTLPELEKVIFGLKEKEISGIVKTRFGYHIITLDSITPQETRPLEQVGAQIRESLWREKEAAAFHDIVGELEKKADIEIYSDRIASKIVD